MPSKYIVHEIKRGKYRLSIKFPRKKINPIAADGDDILKAKLLILPKILHYPKKHNNRLVYLCNWACGIKSDKITAIKGKVTCKNCKNILRKSTN